MLAVSIVVILGVAVLIFITTKRNRKFAGQLIAYAASKGWATKTDSPLVPAMQKQGYHSDKSIMSGSLNGQNFFIYVCQPPIFQTGKQHGDGAATMLSVQFPLSFPDLLLVPSAGVLNVGYDKVATGEFGLQRLTLEADFDKYFRLYTQTGEQVETLEIFTPDMMIEAESEIKDMVLFSGNYVSVCVTLLQDIQTLERLLSEAQLLINKIQGKAQYKLAAQAAQ